MNEQVLPKHIYQLDRKNKLYLIQLDTSS